MTGGLIAQQIQLGSENMLICYRLREISSTVTTDRGVQSVRSQHGLSVPASVNDVSEARHALGRTSADLAFWESQSVIGRTKRLNFAAKGLS